MISRPSALGVAVGAEVVLRVDRVHPARLGGVAARVERRRPVGARRARRAARTPRRAGRRRRGRPSPVHAARVRCSTAREGSAGQRCSLRPHATDRHQGRGDEPEGSPQLRDPRHDRGRPRAARQRGEVAPRGQGADRRRLRPHRQRRDLAAPAHTSRRTSTRQVALGPRADRKRKLLLHSHEIERLRARVDPEHLSLVPLSIYFKDGRAKVELALAKGRKTHDKRQAIAERDADRGPPPRAMARGDRDDWPVAMVRPLRTGAILDTHHIHGADRFRR